MGVLFSSVRFVVQAIKAMMDDYDILSTRVSLSPGIPELNSSVPYWTVPPSPIARHGEDKALPKCADVIIIGSGITGTSIAKTLLERVFPNGDTQPLNVVMLEARDACSGATGRNGGHITPNIYTEYIELRKAHGAFAALQILEFRLAHITTLLAVAKEEDLLTESQARIVDAFDAFMDPKLFRDAEKDLDVFLEEVPMELAKRFEVIGERQVIDKLQLATSILGLIVKPGAAIHPYRFVTGLLSKLLSRFPDFQLFTRTPCTGISTDSGAYVVTTPRGNIRALHIVHSSNAWSSHLLPGMRGKIIPWRAYMTAQTPGQGLMSSKNGVNSRSESWAGSRSFVFYPGKSTFAYDYLTQLLPPPLAPETQSTKSLSPALLTGGEFMFGGGATLGGRSESVLLDNIGVSDDGSGTFEIEAYLCGALERYFSGHWGKEGNSPDSETSDSPNSYWSEARIKASWTGIIGLSADLQPWVGRVPPSVSGRCEPAHSLTQSETFRDDKTSLSNANSKRLSTAARPGEWICAGYTGEGMVHAWHCGREVALMILGVSRALDEPALPPVFLINEQRVKQAKIEDLRDYISFKA